MKIILIMLLIYINFTFSVCIGCNARDTNNESSSTDNKEASLTPRNSNLKSTGPAISEADQYFAGYSRLTLQKFINIRNGTDPYSAFYIHYTYKGNFDQNNYPKDLKILGIFNGELNTINYYNVNQTATGEYSLILENGTPPEGTFTEISYSNSEFGDLFDYIVTESSYFFNGDEFPTEPIDTESVALNPGNYTFTICFFKPSASNDAWAISKSTNELNSVWTGLINIIETQLLD